MMLAKPRLQKGEVAHLFSLLRVLIEERSIKGTYPILDLYCDWSVHGSLDRSAECLRVLEALTGLFVAATESGFEGNEVHDGVNRILGIKQLRTELKQILQSHGLCSICVSDDENWKGFFGLLVQTLVERPLEYPAVPKGKAKEVHNRSMSIAASSDFFIRRFSFSIAGQQLFWKVEARAEFVDIIGPVLWN